MNFERPSTSNNNSQYNILTHENMASNIYGDSSTHMTTEVAQLMSAGYSPNEVNSGLDSDGALENSSESEMEEVEDPINSHQ